MSAAINEKAPHYDKRLQDFLPPLLSIQETPPNPLSHWLARLLILFFILLIAWSYFGRVNVVASANGQLVLQQPSIPIYAPSQAKLERFLVAQGDPVQAGQAVALLSRENDAGQLVESELLAKEGGVISFIDMSKVGQAIAPHSPLLKLSIEQPSLEVEAFISNNDIGFVKVGMPIEVKLHSFPFTRYGLLTSEILDIDYQGQPQVGQGVMFKMRAKLPQQSMQVDMEDIPLRPGMQITAEIQLGHRRLIEFFLSPIIEYQQESLRER